MTKAAQKKEFNAVMGLSKKEERLDLMVIEYFWNEAGMPEKEYWWLVEQYLRNYFDA